MDECKPLSHGKNWRSRRKYRTEEDAVVAIQRSFRERKKRNLEAAAKVGAVQFETCDESAWYSS
jgi:hypothetical protein